MANQSNNARAQVIQTRAILYGLSASAVLMMSFANACQVDRGDLTFDDDAFKSIGGGGGVRAGDGGASYGELPQAGIYFDTENIEVGEVAKLQKGPLLVELTEAADVLLPYDPRQPGAEPEATELPLRASCSENAHALTANPLGFLLYDVDPALVWPGALLQGAAYADGSLVALPASESQRQGMRLTVSTTFAANELALRDIEKPNQGTVSAAIGSMIESEFDDDRDYVASQVAVDWVETKNVSRFLLENGFTARIGAPSQILAEEQSDDSRRTIIVQLVQDSFEVRVHPPEDPTGWFKEDFFEAELPELLSQGDISEDNPPVYVSSVTYGRAVTFSMTSTASYDDMVAVLEIAAGSLEAGGDFSGDARLAKVLEEAEFVFDVLGKGASSSLAEGGWGSFFSKNLELSVAVPIKAELRNLIDNTVAGKTEVATFKERLCTPLMAVPGPFDFGLGDGVALSEEFETVQEVVSLDINGDDVDDLVLNHRQGSKNLVSVIYGGGSQLIAEQTLCAGKTCDFSDEELSWEQYQLFGGDFTGDELPDLLWVPTQDHILATGYSLHLLRGTADGFEEKIETTLLELGGSALAAHPPLVRDMNGDGAMDVVYSFIERSGSQTIQDYQIIVADPSSDDAPFTALPWQIGPGATDVGYTASPPTPLYFEAYDIDLDGNQDLLWLMLGRTFAPPPPPLQLLYVPSPVRTSPCTL